MVSNFIYTQFMKMRKVLIPTDFSNNAMNAINYAINFFKHDVTEFFIMHAYQDDVYDSGEIPNQENLDASLQVAGKNSEEFLKNTVQQIKNSNSNPKHTFRTISSKNLLMDEADKIVDEENMDLVVMGTKGKTNGRKITFGSQTLQILRYVQCPVLSVPENYKYIPPKHILFPTNYMIPYKRRELKLLSKMVAPHKVVIDMLYISKISKLSLRQENNRSFIREQLHANKVNFKTENSKHIVNAIYKYIKENSTDMLIMVNTRHSFLENILFQSTVGELSLYLDIPFLALQNTYRKE